MLLIGIGDERHHGVQRGIPTHVGDGIRVERQPCLGHEHHPGQQTNDKVAEQKSHAVAAPRHALLRARAEQCVQRPFDPAEQRIATHRCAAHHRGHVTAQGPRQRDGQRVHKKSFSHWSALGSEVFGPQHHVQQVRSSNEYGHAAQQGQPARHVGHSPICAHGGAINAMCNNVGSVCVPTWQSAAAPCAQRRWSRQVKGCIGIVHGGTAPPTCAVSAWAA